MSKKKSNNTKKYIYIASFLTPFIVSLIGLIMGGFSPFGYKDVMTSGGYQDIIPFFHEFYDRFQNGSLFSYSLRTGLGYDFSTVITYYLSDPINFIVLLFPKYALLPILNLLYISKLGLAGLLFSIYLIHKNQTKTINPALIVSFSCAYALSSHMIGYGTNITYTTVFGLLPLIVLGIEKIIYERKFGLYIFALTLSFYCNFYIATIVFLFTIIYFLIQEYNNTTHFINSILLKLVGDILSLGISSVIIFNNINSIFYKADISSKFYNKGMYSTIWNTIKMTLTRSLPYQISLDAYGVNIYSGVLCIILIIPFLFAKNLKLSLRVKHLITTILLLVPCYSITSNYIFNGLYLTLNYRAFFGFLVCFMLLNIGYMTIINIDSVHIGAIIASGVTSLAIVILTMINCTAYDNSTPFIVTLELLVVYFIVLMLYYQNKIPAKIPNLIISILLVIEVSFSFILGLRDLGNNTLSYAETDEAKIETVVDTIRLADSSSRVFVYEPSESYSTPLTYLVNGYDYIVASSDIQMDSFLNQLVDINGVSLYENPYSLSNGFVIHKNPQDFIYNAGFPYTGSNLFVQEYMNEDALFTETVGDFSSVKSDTEPDKTYLQFSINNSGDFYTNLSEMTYHYNNAVADTPFMIPYYDSKMLIRQTSLGGELKILDKDTLEKIYSDYASDSILATSDHINSINLSKNLNDSDYYIIPVGESSKWITDGNVSETCIAGDNVLCVHGSGETTINFKPIYYICGFIISIISLIVAFLFTALYRKKSLKLSSENRIIRFINNHDIQIGFLIASSVFFVMLLMYDCCQPFGLKSMIVSDGYAQYYPINTNLFKTIKDGSFSALNYQIGYGIDNLVMSSGSLLWPTSWALILFNFLYSISAYTFLYYLSFILIPQTMYLYLTKRPNANAECPKLTIIAGVTAYSISSYVISYFTFFLSFAILIPLVLLVTENLLYKKKTIPYIIVMTFTMLALNYSAFLLCEFLILYFFITDFSSIKDFFCKGFRFALSSILAACMSAVVLFPFYMFTTESPYKNTDTLPVPGFDNSLLKSIYDLQFLHIPDPVTDNDFRSNSYCGLLILLFIVIYSINKKIKLSVRIRTLLLIFLLYFSYGNAFMNFVLHGFHKQVMVPNRFSIFFIILLITAFIDTFDYIKELNKHLIVICLSIFSSVLAVLMTIVNYGDHSASYIMSIGLIILYTVLIIFQSVKNNKTIQKCLLYVLIFEVITNAYLISHFSMGAPVSAAENIVEETRNISDKYDLGADSLTRTELLNYKMINGSSMTNTNSISYFSSISTLHQSTISLYFNTPAGTNSILYSQGNPLANMLLSVRYFITSMYNDYIEVPSFYNELYSGNGITLYENQYALSPGVFWSSKNNPYMVENDYSKTLDAIKFQNEISNSVISKDLYNIIPTENIDNHDTTSSDTIGIEVDIEESTSSTTNLNVYIPENLSGYVYISYANKIYYLGNTKEGSADTLEIDFGDDYIPEDIYFTTIGILNVDNMIELYDTLSKHTMTNVTYGYNTIEGSITTPESGMVFLSIPAYKSWEAFVDNIPVECGKFMGGLGIPITDAGDHTIKLVYHTAGLKEGIFISSIGLIIFIIYILLITYHRKKSNTADSIEDKEDENESSKDVVKNEYYEVVDQ